ncbi:MAG: flagellar hook-associated protein 1 [Frankiales bacterium]|jgi:flagellar hook-associated protein 1 FlgK|nr:flagellar hook-associated protein 1 [Frankiales bacterium]
MSFSSLNIGASALLASQRAVEVAAHNVANAGTAGYTRQRLAIQTSTPTPGTQGLRGDGMRGTGVAVLSIDRLRDRLADVAYRSEAGVAGASAARSSGLSRTESALGPYAQGAPEAYSRFLAAWDQLALTPADPSARSSVLTNAGGLADSIRSSANGLTDVSKEIELRVGDQVGEVNGLTASVSRLNLAIKDAVSSGSVPNDLYDQRDSAIDRLVFLTGAKAQPGNDPTDVDVVLGGSFLVEGVSSYEMSVGADPLAVLVDGVEETATGQIGGYVSVVNVDIPSFMTQLDSIATGLRDAVNGLHAQSTDLTGAAGAEVFVGDTALEFRLNPDLTEAGVAASKDGQPADGNGALAMSQLRTMGAVDGNTVAAALRAFGARIGQSVTDAKRNATIGELGLAGATEARAAVNGVNIDEEMVDLVKYQHAYSAASRVITVIDEMLDRIINGMGGR